MSSRANQGACRSKLQAQSFENIKFPREELRLLSNGSRVVVVVMSGHRSRPNSRMSNETARERERPSSSMSHIERPPSYASMAPSTSYAGGAPKTPKPSLTRLGGLAERDIQKVRPLPSLRRADPSSR